MPEKIKGQLRIGITSGMSGYFAVMYDDNGIILTGIGRYATREEAILEAEEWAISENLKLDNFK